MDKIAIAIIASFIVAIGHIALWICEKIIDEELRIKRKK